MLNRGHFLFLILLPFLSQVSASDTDEIMAEVLKAQLLSDDSRPEPLPPSLLLNFLRASALNKQNPDTDNENEDSNDFNKDATNPFTKDATNPFNPKLTTKITKENTKPFNGGYGVEKRIFCNAFTGCGGRHRDRSRRQELFGKRLIPVLVKRPFCNLHGCFNSKRAARPFTPFSWDKSAHQRPMLPTYPAMDVNQPVERVVAGKRLFCNGYGGCRGFKRSLYSNWLSKMNSVAAEGRR